MGNRIEMRWLLIRLVSFVVFVWIACTEFASAQPCTIEKVPTPDVFLRPPVDVNVGGLSMRLPSCKILSIGYISGRRHTLGYLRTNGGQIDPSFGSVKAFPYLESVHDPRGTRLHGFFAVPDGLMLSGLLVQSSGVALLATEALLIKFDFEGHLDTTTFRGRATTNFTTNPYTIPRTFIPEFLVRSVAIAGEQAILDLYCPGGKHYCMNQWNDPVQTNLTIGWKTPTLPNDTKILGIKCPNISGTYRDPWNALVTVKTIGCESIAITYDSTDASELEAEYRFKEIVEFPLTGQWMNTRYGGWQRWYVNRGLIRREAFDDRGLIETTSVELVRTTKDELICEHSAAHKRWYLIWQRPDKSCADQWSRF